VISRALVEENGMGAMEPEMRDAHAALVARGIPVETFVAKRLRRGQLPLARTTLVVGTVPVVELALRGLGIELPVPESYPEALRSFLLRRIWPSTLGDVERRFFAEGATCFVKPRARLKRFTGFVCAAPDDLRGAAGASKRTEVWCAEIVRFVTEHRFFVVAGAIVGSGHYDGDPDRAPDASVVAEAVRAWTATGAAARGYGIDFGVLDDGRTALVELNDGYGLGSYGLEPERYLDLCIARWEELAGI
jgi:hypothetical protein